MPDHTTSSHTWEFDGHLQGCPRITCDCPPDPGPPINTTPDRVAVREQLLDDLAIVVLAIQAGSPGSPRPHEAFQRILALIPADIREPTV